MGLRGLWEVSTFGDGVVGYLNSSFFSFIPFIALPKASANPNPKTLSLKVYREGFKPPLKWRY